MLISEIESIKEDWKKIIVKDEEFSERFYKHLFELDPDLKCLFKRSLRMQGRKVVSMFDSAIDQLDKPLMLLPPLLAAGARHEQYHVKDEHYDTMRESFIRTISDFMGDELTSDKEQAWRLAFGVITSIMISGKRGGVEMDRTYHEGSGH